MHRLFNLALLLILTACIRSRPEIIVITQTPLLSSGGSPTLQAVASPSLSAATLIQPTLDPPRQPSDSGPQEYIVRPGDTLSGIAAASSVSVETLMTLNNISDPNILAVGQIIRLPDPPDVESLSFKLIPDSRLVRGPGSRDFDVGQFVSQQTGYIRLATDTVSGDVLTAAAIVERVSLEFSVDARLLLALLEYRASWLTDIDPPEERRIYPLGAEASPFGFDRNGLYRQLTWAADQLNAGYYGWKYRGLSTIEFEEGERVRIATGLNSGTVGVQFMLSQFNDYLSWQQDISANGVYRTYVQYFGDPFLAPVDPLVPTNIEQPPLSLPFAEDEVWLYTGGPHGGWGSGSAWAAIDFAPPDDLTEVESACYVSEHWVTASAPGVIARTADGVVILDLDGDGDESTGWSILYLHLAADGRIAQNTVVNAGDRLGRPSCDGGFSNGTHMHIARRYNGEWLPADCSTCLAEEPNVPFVLGGWRVSGISGQEYQGLLINGNERVIAEQGRLTTENLVSWR